MPTSVEKITELREGAPRMPSAESSPTDLLLIQAARSAGPLLDSFLPSDPESLDNMLEQAIRWLASLRSDDAPDVTIYEDEIPDAEIVE